MVRFEMGHHTARLEIPIGRVVSAAHAARVAAMVPEAPRAVYLAARVPPGQASTILAVTYGTCVARWRCGIVSAGHSLVAAPCAGRLRTLSSPAPTALAVTPRSRKAPCDEVVL